MSNWYKMVVGLLYPKDNQALFAREYELYLPGKEELKKQNRIAALVINIKGLKRQNG